jgi:hypothetical protein
MAEITLKFDENRITLGDLLRLEERANLRATMEVLSNHMVNGDGEYLPAEEGFKALEGMTVVELRRASEAFVEAAKGSDDPK